MSESNYSIVREQIHLEDWSDETGALIKREPTNGELLRLLDALHADVTGTTCAEVDKIEQDRWWNS